MEKDKILLIGPHLWERKTWYPPNMFPLGLGYIASVLRETGHDVSVLDINANNYSKDVVEKKIKESNFEVIGIGGLVTAYKYVNWLSEVIKKHHPETKIVVGGLVATSIPELLLNTTKVDVLIMGEGEYTIKELIPKLLNSENLHSIAGIYYREGGKNIQTKPRERIENLDSIPFPAWDLFPIEDYVKRAVQMSKGRKNMNMITSRGCPFYCTFCHRNFGRIVRLRSAKNVIEEIFALKEKYGVEYITFNDELFTTNKNRVMELCDKMISEKIGIEWGCSSRVNTIDEEMLIKMKEAGCTNLCFGIESGSQKMLDTMHKGVTREQNKKAILLAKKAGLKPNATMMAGNFGETKETIQETLDFCKEVDIYGKLYYTTPFPNTELYNEALRGGLIKDEKTYIEGLRNVTNLYLNLTDMPDSELIKLKENAEKQISSTYFKKHMPEILKKRMLEISEYVIDFYRTEGFWNTLKMIWRTKIAKGQKLF